MNTSFTIHDCTLIDVPTFKDERGSISVIDKELPFQVKRVFWLYHIQEGKDRGAQGHPAAGLGMALQVRQDPGESRLRGGAEGNLMLPRVCAGKTKTECAYQQPEQSRRRDQHVGGPAPRGAGGPPHQQKPVGSPGSLLGKEREQMDRESVQGRKADSPGIF